MKNQFKKFTFFLYFLLLIIFQIEAQSKWFSGNDRLSDLVTPGLSATGAPILYNQSPMADTLNPALSAFRQRMTLDISYGGIAGKDTLLSSSIEKTSIHGNLLSLALSIPDKSGTYTLSGFYTNGMSHFVPYGHQGGINLSYARDIYDDLYFGIGINTAFKDGKNTPWMVAFDIGFINIIGDIGPIKNLSWAFSLQNIGWGTLPFLVNSKAPVSQSLFTPELGVSFIAYEHNDFILKYSAGLSLPSFVNFRLKNGFTFAFKDVFELDIATTLDAKELSGAYPYKISSYGSLLPSIGFTYRYKAISQAEKDYEVTEAHIRTSAAAVSQLDLWHYSVGVTIPFGEYDQSPPKIIISPKWINSTKKTPISHSLNKKSLLVLNKNKKEYNLLDCPKDYKIATYLSPNNDGKMDTLEIPFSISDHRFIKGYRFIIINDKGKIVRIINNKEFRKENQNFIKRLFRKEKMISIPNQLIWDGTTTEGNIVEDGIYHFIIEAWDDNQNYGTEGFYSFKVDSTPPTIKINPLTEKNNLIFSPNNDGNKDVFSINQSGSKEDKWIAQITNQQKNVVKEFIFNNSAPRSINWDGKNNKNLIVPDGVYHYSIKSEDKAGNSQKSEIKNIIVSTQKTPIYLEINKSHISPNNDGNNDSIIFTADIKIKEGISNWEFLLLDEKKNVIYQEINKDEIPQAIKYKGKLLNNKKIEEGIYQALLKVNYNNGNQPISYSPYFTIDYTKPTSIIMADYDIFSPDGDGNKDIIRFRQESSREQEWIGTILNGDNEVIFKNHWYGNVAPIFDWNGFDSKGKNVKDGKYSYLLEATDKAGNYGCSNKITFELNAQKTPVRLSLSTVNFSPNGDSIKDSIEFIPYIKIKSGIEQFSLNIRDKKNNIVKKIKTGKKIKTKYIWDGFSENLIKAKDGEYKAELTVKYKKGNQVKIFSNNFKIDTVPPQIVSTIENKIFSPDRDGKHDNLVIMNKGSFEHLWTASILDLKGNSVYSQKWFGTPINFVWNGTDNNGNIVSDGQYSYQIESQDKSGNNKKAIINNIILDTRPTKIFLTQDEEIISPNGDNYKEVVKFKIKFSLPEGIKSWNFNILPFLSQKPIKTFKGKEKIPEEIVWDGKDEKNTITDGKYKIVFYAKYYKGNEIEHKDNTIIVDTTPPKVNIKISPLPFSPDNDGINDELKVKIEIDDLNNIEKWLFNIYDPKKRNFKQYKGIGLPTEKIIWDGRSSFGDLVFSAEDYFYQFQILDEAGNITTVDGIIPIDILIIRDGDKLKIQISNINFSPNSAFMDFKKNKLILKRLSQILNKYNRYQILIEGHANAVKWSNPELAKKEEINELAPLSKARAIAVMDYLIELGIDSKRLSAVGRGGTNPIVDPKKNFEKWEKNLWQNRRVEFILVK